MLPVPMVIPEETRRVPIQAVLAEYDHVIQTLAANGPGYLFDIRTLPQRMRR